MVLEKYCQEIKQNIEYALAHLESENIISTEAFYNLYEKINVDIRNSELLNHVQNIIGGIGFRVALKDNKVGFASTNNLLKDKILSTAKNSIKIARISSSNPDYSIPESSNPKKIKGLYNSDIIDLEIEDLIGIAKSGLESAEEYDKRITVKNGVVSIEHGFRGIINSLGVNVEDWESKIELYLGTVGIEGQKVTGMHWEQEHRRDFNIDPIMIGTKAGESTLKLLNPKRIESFEGAVIFSPNITQLFQIITNAVKGDNVLLGASAWNDKIGDQVCDETLSIYDNSTLDENIASHAFDDEGTPTQRTSLVEKGELIQFMQNCTSANGLEDVTTANASRYVTDFDIARMIIGGGYKTQPTVYSLNLTIKPGSKSLDQLITETEKGVFVDSMAGFPQVGSGVISAQLSNAFLIENGEIVFPLKDVMIAGNGYEWLMQISGIANDSKQFLNHNIPSLRVEKVRIIGK
ncbi:MAG: TldD/PmbA family protein [Candidatus Hodarchaeota archaeon]